MKIIFLIISWGLSITAGILIFGSIGMNIFLCWTLISNETGLLGFIIACIFAPLTYAMIPFYTLLKYHSWNLLIIGYGGPLIGIMIGFAGSMFNLEKKR